MVGPMVDAVGPLTVPNGIERVAEAFARARASGRRAALMPYLMGGYPDLATSRAIGVAYADSGADLIELGVPFSDPLADGPVIHAAATAALQAGATLPAVLEVARVIAERVPVILMCYANVIFARGLERFADLLVAASVSGLIVPDLPLEEAADALEACERRGLALVPLVAPTTPAERLARIGASARGFLYTVSLTGTTGERTETISERTGTPGERTGTTGERTGTTGERTAAAAGFADLVVRAAAQTDVPVAVGFGIGTPEQAADAAAAGADGVIVGSRLVRAAGESDDPVMAVSELMRSFSSALSAAG
jgi:tryptophan synthase alpha chain